jgi:hypothetical protein
VPEVDPSPVWVDATVAALHLQLAYGVMIRPATIRQWGRRGHITRRRQGRARYNLLEVVAHATARGLVQGG